MKISSDYFEIAQNERLTFSSEQKVENKKAKHIFYRLMKHKGAFIGLIIISTIVLFAIFGPYLNSYGVDEQNMLRANLPPKIPVLEHISWLHVNGVDIRGVDQYAKKGVDEYFWFGTDALGRDQWTRVWQGTRVSLYIAFLAAAIDLVIGVFYGGISAFYGGKVDIIMQRIIDILVGIPNLILIILLILVLEPGIISITLALVITGWVGMARIVRGQVLKLKEYEYVLAARTLGASHFRIITKHLIPNALGMIIVTAMFTVPSAIFFEAFLSFIGLGLTPPQASLGTLIDTGFKSLQIYPHLAIFPATIISLIMISFNLLGDGLRDVLDPKTNR